MFRSHVCILNPFSFLKKLCSVAMYAFFLNPFSFVFFLQSVVRNPPPLPPSQKKIGDDISISMLPGPITGVQCESLVYEVATILWYCIFIRSTLKSLSSAKITNFYYTNNITEQLVRIPLLNQLGLIQLLLSYKHLMFIYGKINKF